MILKTSPCYAPSLSESMQNKNASAKAGSCCTSALNQALLADRLWPETPMPQQGNHEWTGQLVTWESQIT